MEKTTAGTLTLSGANTYTGTTTIAAGTLVTDAADGGGAGALGNGGNITFTGGTLQYTANSDASDADYSNRIKNSTSAINLDTNSLNVTMAGVMDNTNTAGLTKLGAGTMTLTGANTYTGATTISVGTLALGAPE